MPHNKTHKKQLPLIIILSAFLVACGVYALGQAPAAAPTGDASSNEVVDIERQKLEIARQTLELEKQKTWLTAGLTIVPLIIGLIAIYSQVKTAFQLKEAETKTAFELKAAEIVMNSEDPFSAFAKAEALSKLFPERVSKNFANSFDPGQLSGPGLEEIKVLLPLLVEYKDQKQEVLNLWKQISPMDAEWIDEINV